ncbi:hypothetical protein EYD45_04955 [Hyunsoonleella flava]|uniref:Capsular biosynthesis protein n=1 Tax=Hyunsoonleella flava TaxID=2527939 RepID=A0A4Q9FGR4_9FLAO|nr:hypothetical protein [Hyunsoonleella flava]TBN05626.1 hypothetical protein EYD45_04955 [Hyunsoonleella flava]
MKVLCIGYYDKFSRFFIGIKKELKKEFPGLEFKIKSIFFSGFFYAFIRNTSSSFLPFKSWLNVLFNKKKYLTTLNKSIVYKNINLESLIYYHVKLNTTISKRDLLLQAMSYLDILDKEFIKHKPNIVLLIGDSRLAIEVTKTLAKVYNSKVYYIEQGPFGTTFFDAKGVNANASIKDFVINNKVEKNSSKELLISSFINRSKQEKYRRSLFYRSCDYLFNLLFKSTIIFPPDLSFTDTFQFPKKTKKSLAQLKPNKTINQSIFFLILQVPLDVNMIYHSTFKNHFDILKKVYESLPNNAQLVIREHPVYKGKYEKRLYDYAKLNSIAFDTTNNIREILEIASVVVVNNSTVGLEAIAKYKPTVVLGNSYYANPKICLTYDNGDNLSTILSEAINFKPDRDAIYRFLHELFFNHLIEGFITDQELNAAKRIAERIIKEHSTI